MTRVGWLPVGRRGRLLLVFPAACAVFTMAVVMYLEGLFDPASVDWVSLMGGMVFSTAVTGYNLLGPLALAVLVVIGSRRMPRAMGVITAACVVYSAATVYSLLEMTVDESSTAVLLLLFLPIYLSLLLIPFAAVGVLVQWSRSRTEARDGHAGQPVVMDWQP